MDHPFDVSAHLRTRLASLAAEHGVPAASAAVVVGDEIVAHATGLLSVVTRVEATADAVFQIGSITKVWTATLVMQLVDEGLVDLDAPVRRYLPEFVVADAEAAGAITVRHLLSHRAGFEGDIFTDTGRGDDAVERFVALLADVPQIFAPGTTFSYNNAGYVVLGRLVEVLRGAPWQDVLRERIAEPLGLASVSPSPYEAILHRAAVGHLDGADGAPEPAPIWAMARSNEPAGSMLAMTAHDLAVFARAHLPHEVVAGTDADAEGPALLTPASRMLMSETAVRLPQLAGMGEAWGLGWEIARDAGARLFGHDGNTVGQSSFLRIAPDAGVAVVLLTNGGDGLGLFHDLFDELLEALTGEGLPAEPVPPAEPVAADVEPFLGVYANSTVEMEVSRDGAGTLWLEQRPAPALRALGAEPSRDELVVHSAASLILRHRKDGMHVVLAFLGTEGDAPASHLHVGRAVARAR